MRLIDAEAWADAALALLELELPLWQVHRIAYDQGEWYFALSRERELPEWLERSIEAQHADLALALLSAFVEAHMLSIEATRPSVPRSVKRWIRYTSRWPTRILADVEPNGFRTLARSSEILQKTSSARSLARFAARILLLVGFAAFSSAGFGRALAALLWMAIILCAVVALIRREPLFGGALNHWDEGVALGALLALVHVVLDLSA
jgi:hypothetical protein